MKTKEFIEGRGLDAAKVSMLMYLEKISDVFDIEPQPKGRSIVKCEFDCGAYKGSETFKIRVCDLNPIRIAIYLMSLTSGHHFGFPEGEEALLQEMESRLTVESV